VLLSRLQFGQPDGQSANAFQMQDTSAQGLQEKQWYPGCTWVSQVHALPGATGSSLVSAGGSVVLAEKAALLSSTVHAPGDHQ
jgi:hypothetical protein